MAKVEIIAKLKQKNDADFKIADAKDIEMEDGSDLQSTIDNIKKNGKILIRKNMQLKKS